MENFLIFFFVLSNEFSSYNFPFTIKQNFSYNKSHEMKYHRRNYIKFKKKEKSQKLT